MHTLHIPPPSWLQDASFHAVFQALKHNGIDLRAVGGCVRDTLMKRNVHDIDACTPAPPEAVLHALTHAGIRAIPTGIQHGTITAHSHGKNIEITTLRHDIRCDGRHAQVQFTHHWDEDALRRDFTINALSMDAQGTIYDYTTGLEDIAHHRIRFIGDPHQRITEDYLRILRFFRFFATHGDPSSPLDEAALHACQLYQHHLHQLSAERIQQEMLKLLGAQHPLTSILTLHQLGIDATVCTIAWDNTVITSALPTLLAWEQHYAITPNPLLRLALLTAHAPIEQRLALMKRWKCSNAYQKIFAILCGAEPTTPHDPQRIKPLIRRYGKDIATLLIGRDMALHASIHDMETCQEAMHLCNSWVIPALPITGDDLLSLGFTAGHTLGNTLKDLEHAWEASDYSLTKEALLTSLSRHHLPL
jgi:poly(A) polymerase